VSATASMRAAAPADATPGRTAAMTAASARLYACEACTLVSRPVAALDAEPHASPRCPRCGAHLHVRKPDSITRVWGFLIASYILYLPANLLPIMNTSSLFGAQNDTILSGVIYLWQTGSVGTAAVVFVASVFVPVLKLAVLTFLVVSVQRKWTWRPLLRSRLFQVVSFIGRWSMLDIFVVAVLVALVQIKAVAEIEAGPAALAFGAVVVLTIFAANSFDSRLIWDAIHQKTAPGDGPDAER
jgi:paraquat-inducible protein A